MSSVASRRPVSGHRVAEQHRRAGPPRAGGEFRRRGVDRRVQDAARRPVVPGDRSQQGPARQRDPLHLITAG